MSIRGRLRSSIDRHFSRWGRPKPAKVEKRCSLTGFPVLPPLGLSVAKSLGRRARRPDAPASAPPHRRPASESARVAASGKIWAEAWGWPWGGCAWQKLAIWRPDAEPRGMTLREGGATHWPPTVLEQGKSANGMCRMHRRS